MHLYKVRLLIRSQLLVPLLISIHAPIKVRPSSRIKSSSVFSFQSTHLFKVRLKEFDVKSALLYFNPRIYLRCDDFITTPISFSQDFNPHTYMRCDCMSSAYYSLYTNFNPRTYMRCDELTDPSQCLLAYFNPRTYMRCDTDLCSKSITNTLILFKSIQIFLFNKVICIKIINSNNKL